MKKLLLLLMLTTQCLYNIAKAQDDDMYFTSSKSKTTNNTSSSAYNSSNSNSKASYTLTPVAISTPNNTTVRVSSTSPSVVSYTTNARNEDEYNRRYTNSSDYENEENINEEEIEDTIYVDIDDDENDFLYSRRILRFHSPRYVYISSPYYWDLVYGYGIFDYLLDPYIYDPFFWHYGWRYGWSWGPWSTWYGPIWGWHTPHHWDYWYGPGWSRTFYHTGGHYLASRGRNNPGLRQRVTGLTRNAITANRFGTSSRSNIRTSAVASSRNSYPTRNTRNIERATTTSHTRTGAIASSRTNTSRLVNSGTLSNRNNISGRDNRTSATTLTRNSRINSSREQATAKRDNLRQNAERTTRDVSQRTVTNAQTSNSRQSYDYSSPSRTSSSSYSSSNETRTRSRNANTGNYSSSTSSSRQNSTPSRSTSVSRSTPSRSSSSFSTPSISRGSGFSGGSSRGGGFSGGGSRGGRR